MTLWGLHFTDAQLGGAALALILSALVGAYEGIQLRIAKRRHRRERTPPNEARHRDGQEVARLHDFEPAPALPKRRYKVLTIVLQLFAGGFWLMLGLFVALMYLGDPVTNAEVDAAINDGGPIHQNWADRIGLFLADHILLTLGVCAGTLAVLAIVAELINRRRRRRIGRQG